MLTKIEALSILGIFGFLMIGLVYLSSKKGESSESFLVADRNVSLFRSSLSIAVSWIWAPAIFICSLQSFTKGLPGIFWFTLPNIICFFVFAPFAVKIREKFPKGYTLPEYIYKRFDGNKRAHLSILSFFIAYQLFAMVINSLAGGTLIHLVSGLEIKVSIVLMTGIALTYSLMSGLRASLITDVLQMLLILLVAFILVPLCLKEVSGFQSVIRGIGGESGEFTSLFNPWIAFTMGIPMTISLIAGPFVDQMFFQRVFAVKKKYVAKTFMYGGLIFALVPIVLSLLGFIGADLARQGLITVNNPQLVAPEVIAYLLPKGALYAFCFMAFAGLCSTIDSSFCGISSLVSIDIYKNYLYSKASDKKLLFASRLGMIGVAFIGTSISLLNLKLLWVFLIYGTVASVGVFPVIFSILSEKISPDAIFWSVITGMLVGLPVSIYANLNENSYLIVFAPVFSSLIGLLICGVSVLKEKGKEERVEICVHG